MLLNPLVWLCASIAAYAAAVNAAWVVLACPERFGRAGERLAALSAQGPRSGALTALRTTHLFGMPAAALALRVIQPAAAGWQLPRPWWSLAVALCLAPAVAALVLAGQRWLLAAAGRDVHIRFRRPAPLPVGEMAQEALVRQAYWAFVRAAVISAGIGGTSTSVFLGLGLIALQAWTNPWRRAAYDEIGGASGLVPGAGLAILSGLAFLLTTSSAACLAADLLASTVLFSVVPASRHGAARRPVMP